MIVLLFRKLSGNFKIKIIITIMTLTSKKYCNILSKSIAKNRIFSLILTR